LAINFRKLGKTGLIVSEIGLGTAQIGGPSWIGGRYLGSPRITREEALSILDIAYASGINIFDTSDKYGDGNAERLLGSAFRRRRDKVILATKCGITNSGERCFEKKYVKGCLEKSLKNLGTDYVDIFQLTKPPLEVIKSGAIYEIFDELKREGGIRFSGVSTGTDQETLLLVSDSRVDTLQIFYNLLHIEPNEIIIGKAVSAGIGLITRSPLSSGVLTGKFNKRTTFSEEDDRSLFLFGDTLSSRIDMVEKIISRFKLNSSNTIMHFSLNYLLSNEKISTIIPGVSNIGQLSGLLKLCGMKRMSADYFNKVEEFIKEEMKRIK
jgi:aryl-alcohol dehydrogenase-like predicted oxidoreductase